MSQRDLGLLVQLSLTRGGVQTTYHFSNPEPWGWEPWGKTRLTGVRTLGPSTNSPSPSPSDGKSGQFGRDKGVIYQCWQENPLSRPGGDVQGPCFLQTRQWALVLLPFNVNRIHKHIKNLNMTQENTHGFIYRYLQTSHTKKKKNGPSD